VISGLWSRSLRNGASFFPVLFLLPPLAFTLIFPRFLPMFPVSQWRVLAQQESHCFRVFSNLTAPSTLTEVPGTYSLCFLTSAFHNVAVSFTWHMPAHLKDTVHSTRKDDVTNPDFNSGLGCPWQVASVSTGYTFVRLEVSARENWSFSWIRCAGSVLRPN